MQGIPVGELLFKFLMQKKVIFMEDTASHFRENLTNLETYITMVNLQHWDFPKKFKVNMEGLKAMGESTDDLVANLFKAYHMV